ncbi:hypothetical protein VTL71DRAFT_11625 [Oculimacula yallundae]|uniref:Uncharacterized protein n=1 Tax=Oculimacula yallundae TaxID=86028 RepID=A0ABR4CRA9_9HELO
MCQVVPYTLPCCRKVYVEVSKLPSCPRSWPNRKCPSELCIQVRGYEAEDRDTGTCWRCKARISGVSNLDRESLRPRIDKATLVLGLDEIGVIGRRRREERNGNCWFCGATGGCKTCGAKDIVVEEDEPAVQTGKRKRDQVTYKGKEMLKKPKVEKREQHKAPMKALEYPTPNTTSHSQQPNPQFYDESSQNLHQTHGKSYRTNAFPHNLMEQPNVLNHLETETLQQPISANWRPIRIYQNHPTVPSSTFQAQQIGHFTNDGRLANSKSHYDSNEHLLRAEPEEYTNIRHDRGSSRIDAPEQWFDRMNYDDEQVGVGPQYHLNEHLSRPVPVATQDHFRQQNGSPRLSNNGPGDQQSSLHQIGDEQQDLTGHGYDGYNYSSYPYPNMKSEAQEAHNQDTRGYADENAALYQRTQVVSDDTQHTFQPENTSQQSILESSIDPNIQPDLDDFPPEVSDAPSVFDPNCNRLQFDVTKLDDATLARLLKKYGGSRDGENAHGEVHQESVNEYGSAFAGEQNVV